MTQEKRFAVAVMLVLMAGLTQALPTRAQGSSWESSSKKGKAKDSGMMLAKETGVDMSPASMPLRMRAGFNPCQGCDCVLSAPRDRRIGPVLQYRFDFGTCTL